MALAETTKGRADFGLKYLKHLLGRLKGEGKRDVFWILPTKHAQRNLFDWSRREGFSIEEENCYVAPRYGSEVEDRDLLALLEQHRPTHVIVAIGSGAQEKLGYFMRENLSYRPAIHCIGAALGFITGDQISIPDWADRFYLGWFFRLLAQPRVFIPRLSRAFQLPRLILKYGEKLPPMRGAFRNQYPKIRSPYQQLIYHPHLILSRTRERRNAAADARGVRSQQSESDHVSVISIRGRLNEQLH